MSALRHRLRHGGLRRILFCSSGSSVRRPRPEPAITGQPFEEIAAVSCRVGELVVSELMRGSLGMPSRCEPAELWKARDAGRKHPAGCPEATRRPLEPPPRYVLAAWAPYRAFFFLMRVSSDSRTTEPPVPLRLLTTKSIRRSIPTPAAAGWERYSDEVFIGLVSGRSGRAPNGDKSVLYCFPGSPSITTAAASCRAAC